MGRINPPIQLLFYIPEGLDIMIIPATINPTRITIPAIWMIVLALL